MPILKAVSIGESAMSAPVQSLIEACDKKIENRIEKMLANFDRPSPRIISEVDLKETFGL